MERTVGSNIVLIGTAHVSERSVEEVREAIRRHRPDIVAVELDPARYKVLTGEREWKDLPITRIISGTNPYFFIAQAFLSAMQRRIGREQGVEPGAQTSWRGFLPTTSAAAATMAASSSRAISRSLGERFTWPLRSTPYLGG